MAFSSESIGTLEAKGYVHADGRVRRADIASDIAGLLRSHHVAEDLEHVATSVATLDELSVRLFGESNPELRSLVTQLASVGPAGLVQRTLANGYVLCAHSVVRVVGQVDGHQVTRRFTGRFLSESPEVVKVFALDPLIVSVERAMRRIRSRAELVQLRIPGLETEVRSILMSAAGRARAELSGGSTDEDTRSEMDGQ